MADDGYRVTVAELGRRLDRIETVNKSSFQSLHRRLDVLNYVHPETLALQMQLERALREALDDRIDDLEAAQQWLVRTVAVAIITAVVGVLVATSGWTPQ